MRVATPAPAGGAARGARRCSTPRGRSRCVPSWPGSAARWARSATSTSCSNGCATEIGDLEPAERRAARRFPAPARGGARLGARGHARRDVEPALRGAPGPARGGGRGAARPRCRRLAAGHRRRGVPQAPQGRAGAPARPVRRRAARGPHPGEAGPLRGRAGGGRRRQAGSRASSRTRSASRTSSASTRTPSSPRSASAACSSRPSAPARTSPPAGSSSASASGDARPAPASREAWARLEKSGKRAWTLSSAGETVQAAGGVVFRRGRESERRGAARPPAPVRRLDAPEGQARARGDPRAGGACARSRRRRAFAASSAASFPRRATTTARAGRRSSATGRCVRSTATSSPHREVDEIRWVSLEAAQAAAQPRPRLRRASRLRGRRRADGPSPPPPRDCRPPTARRRRGRATSLRPLDERGRRQADALPALYAGFGSRAGAHEPVRPLPAVGRPAGAGARAAGRGARGAGRGRRRGRALGARRRARRDDGRPLHARRHPRLLLGEEPEKGSTWVVDAGTDGGLSRRDYLPPPA